jgi:hypothetical protein
MRSNKPGLSTVITIARLIHLEAIAQFPDDAVSRALLSAL